MTSKAVLKFEAKWDEISGAKIDPAKNFYLSSFYGVGNIDKLKEYWCSAHNVKIDVKKVMAGSYTYKHDKKRLAALGKLDENSFCVKFDGVLFGEEMLEELLTYIEAVQRIEHWHMEGDFVDENKKPFKDSVDLLVFVDANNDVALSSCFDENQWKYQQEHPREPEKPDNLFGAEYVSDMSKVDIDSIKINPPLVVEEIENVSTATFDPLAW
jgi:hypothetical protein